jgi:hypothetical protein
MTFRRVHVGGYFICARAQDLCFAFDRFNPMTMPFDPLNQD